MTYKEFCHFLDKQPMTPEIYDKVYKAIVMMGVGFGMLYIMSGGSLDSALQDDIAEKYVAAIPVYIQSYDWLF